MKITVLLVDDHQLVRKGFRRILEDNPDIEVVGEAGTGVDAIEMVGKLAPRVVGRHKQQPVPQRRQAGRRLRPGKEARHGRCPGGRAVADPEVLPAAGARGGITA